MADDFDKWEDGSLVSLLGPVLTPDTNLFQQCSNAKSVLVTLLRSRSLQCGAATTPDTKTPFCMQSSSKYRLLL